MYLLVIQSVSVGHLEYMQYVSKSNGQTMHEFEEVGGHFKTIQKRGMHSTRGYAAYKLINKLIKTYTNTF